MTLSAAAARAAQRLDTLTDLDLPEPPALAHGADLRGDHPALPVVSVARSGALAAVDRGETRYVDGAGILPLRQAVARRLEALGIGADPAHGVLITGGEQEARFLAIKGLAMSGRRLVLPAIVHPGVRKAAALSGIERITIPLDLSEGTIDIDAARRALRGSPAALYYESPNRLTGRLISADTAAAVEAIAVEAGALVVCDAGLAGWVGPDAVSSHAASLGATGKSTVRIGTVWTGAGVEGWLIAYLTLPPAIYAESRRLKQVMAMCTSVPVQWGVLSVLTEGGGDSWPQIAELAEVRRRAIRKWPDAVLKGDVVTLLAVRLPEDLPPAHLPRGMPGSVFGAAGVMRYTVTFDGGVVDALSNLSEWRTHE